MASKVDAETWSQRLQKQKTELEPIQKGSGNGHCCDCNANHPQWASPKFGIFICLDCAGRHRALGVHISFVRSINMDLLNDSEIERLRLGGNASWRTFFEGKSLSWDDPKDPIAHRYGGEVGEEWKERLTAKVEGREYVPTEKKKNQQEDKKQSSTATHVAMAAGRGGGACSGPPLAGSASSRTASPAPGGTSGKVKVDEKYFARLAADNANRPEDLPPNLGGRYTGFGNTPMPPKRDDQVLPGLDELQKDPVAALTKGFGWLALTVTKTAKTVNDDFIQPTAKQISESDFAAQARVAAGSVAKTAQAGAKSAHQGLNRFVEGPTTGGYRQVPFDESKRDFWDDFSNLADQRKQENSSIGTAAMGKGSNTRSSGPAKKSQDEWDDW